MRAVYCIYSRCRRLCALSSVYYIHVSNSTKVPVVDPQLTVVERKDLTELLIQGFYCFHQYNIDDCLLCLTDLYRFHYMKVTKAAPRMAIKWAKSISFSFEEKQRQKQMQEHFSFIAAAIA